MEAINLTQVPVVDNHCHGIARDQTFEDIVSWRMAFTESTDPGMARDHVASTSMYRRLIPTLADFLGCVPEEEAVFVARTRRDGMELAGELLRAANVDTLLLDTGFPPPETVFPVPELGELAGCRAEPMLRLEVLMEDLLEDHDTLVDAEQALAATLDDVRGSGYVALKSIVHPRWTTHLNVCGRAADQSGYAGRLVRILGERSHERKIDVDVRIDKPGKHELARRVDHFRVRRSV